MSDEILLTDDNIAPMQEELFRLYSQGFLTDITLSCEDGKNFEAHRVLLAARSQYFYGIVPKLKVEPVIFLKGVKGSHLEKILKFIYSGSATVSRSQLRPILEVAKSLQIRGLQELAPTELSRGTNTSVSCSTKYGGGSKTSSPVPPKKESEQCFRSSPSSQSARDRDIAVQQQQKLYDKLTSAKKSPCKPGHSHGDKHSPSYKSSSHKRGSRPAVKIPSTKSLKAEENGEETFKFQYQYISDDSEEIDKDDSNDSDFELAAKRNQNQLQAKGSPLKKKRGRPPKNHVATDMSGSRKKYEKEESEDEDVYDTNIGTASKSSSDDDTDNSSDELDNDQDLDNDSSDSDSDNESEDQSDDEESGHSFPQPDSPKTGTKQTSPKKAPEPSKVKREDGPSGSAEEFYDSPPAPPRRSGGSGRGPMINGKHILPVQCKGKRAELHLSKFGNGTNGKSIKYKGDWMTPEAYEQACGGKTRKYLESITTDYGPLKTLTASGLLKPHPKKCKCSACSDEVLTSSPEKSPKKEEKREGSKKETVKSEVPTFDKHTESEKPKHRKREPSIDMDDPDGDKDVKKRKKDSERPERSESRPKPPFSSTPSQPSPSLSTCQSSQSKPAELTSSHRHSSPKPHFSKHHSRTDPSTASKASPPITCSPSKLASPSIHKSEIIAPPTLTTTKPVLTSPATCTASVSSHSSFSPSTNKPLASPSFIALSPATSMNPLPPIQSSLTSSVVPFPSKLSGIPSTGSPSLSSLPSYSQPSPLPSPLTTTTTPVSITTTSPTTTSFAQVKVENKNAVSKQQIAIQMGPPKPGEFSTGPAAVSGVQQQVQQQHQHQQQQQGPGSLQHKGGGRVGSVMQVRCKSVPALLYVAKYESGSKGKCILVGDEWMTPNEYEEKSGSKAKKYLSSIKCLGRPLRAYVNSGELRGTGPPPSPKPPKMNKPKPPQLIAPAPSPGQSLSMGSTLGMAPPGMSPAHMPGTLPQSLTQVAMMSGVSVGQPIILNQSNLANSMHNQMLAPMTLTFAPMTTAGMGQQQQQPTQQQQQHHLQQHQMHHQQQQQQLHGSGEYILQHK